MTVLDQKLRLTPKDVQSIIESFKESFHEGDHVWLFGSRVDLKKRGGDIDLYIEVQGYDVERVYKSRSQFWRLLQERLGAQKIDIVINNPKQNLLIYQVARAEGVCLI